MNIKNIHKKEYKMFNKMKKGYTLVELLVVMIIVGILSIWAAIDYSKTTTSSKIESVSSIFKNYHLAISMYATQNDYQKLIEQTTAISDGDEDMLDELTSLGIINTEFPKDMFEEPTNVIVEIRIIKVDGYKRVIYLFVDSTNTRDKYILEEAINKLNFVNQL